jgi:hypothetical protein
VQILEMNAYEKAFAKSQAIKNPPKRVYATPSNFLLAANAWQRSIILDPAAVRCCS